jgi:Spy/CpxP family protein refolding chaperone
MRTILMAVTLGVAVLVGAPDASAFGMGHGFFGGPGGPGPHGGPGGHGGPAGMPLRLLLAQMTPAQLQQVRTIFLADRDERHAAAEKLRSAHEALADKMFSTGPVTAGDVAPLLENIGALHQQLLDHGTSVMLKVRALATPEQIAKAADTKKQLDALHAQIDALLGHVAFDDDDQPE